MESNGKSLILQRTIGAVVLIAAAAILIPLALDGQGLKTGKETVQIPEEPTFELQLDENDQPRVRLLQAKGEVERVEQEAIDADAAEPVSPGEDVLAGEGGSTGETPDDAATPQDSSAPGSDKTAVAAKPAVVEKTPEPPVTEAPVTAAPESKPVLPTTPKPAPAVVATPPPARNMEDIIQQFAAPGATVAARPLVPTPTPAPAAGVAESWSIQLGAFKDRSNAQGIVSQLTAKGYRAYINASSPGVFRVLVGPEIRRDRADQLRGRVAADTGFNGVVVRYVP